MKKHSLEHEDTISLLSKYLYEACSNYFKDENHIREYEEWKANKEQK